ncbi:class D sortase [Virgibacillus halodenitrificans]|uniref:Class D sortase n=1 Tax=Virgibacillus halodenitrificans TaxID=1482 RepID=A0ABR7VMQ7_VIRHA|nr:class D sortase [Virgibacillus halodenitrificans]MBD1223185.1 class D sortase [Virgibacillus halodenitrificans]CDQ30858.1 sortase [Virgibacillus halodenitrificans]
MKKLAILLVFCGIVFLSYGGYQWYKTTNAQKESLAEAENLLNQANATSEKQSPGTSFSPQHGETSGILHIPKLEADLPIVEGTDEDDLEKGVGHYSGTAYPQQDDQIVLSGHRDTVFRRMGELQLGDILTVKLPYGDFSYEIVETKVVPADDLSVIASTAPNEILTVTTCYPFSYIGNAPDRYIITAIPTKVQNK